MSAFTPAFDATIASKPARPSIFRRVLSSMIEARQRQAARQVNTILLDMDDATLEACGYNRAELRKRSGVYRQF